MLDDYFRLIKGDYENYDFDQTTRKTTLKKRKRGTGFRAHNSDPFKCFIYKNRNKVQKKSIEENSSVFIKCTNGCLMMKFVRNH